MVNLLPPKKLRVSFHCGLDQLHYAMHINGGTLLGWDLGKMVDAFIIVFWQFELTEENLVKRQPGFHFLLTYAHSGLHSLQHNVAKEKERDSKNENYFMLLQRN